MTTFSANSRALTPATLAFRDDGTAFSPQYDDVYHSAEGAFAQSVHVFLHGNTLPGRWQNRRIFAIFETGFGLGVNFLATWAVWRDDPARCERLHFVSIEKHPFGADDLRRAHEALLHDARARLGDCARELADAWPMLVPGMHRLEFDAGRVVLTLLFGDAIAALQSVWLRADAFYLDGFAPAKNPDLWSPAVFKSLTRIAGDGATFATWSSAGEIKRALEQNGFTYRKVPGFGTKRAMLVGEFAPRWRVRRHEPPLPFACVQRHAIVVGAGLAGCALAERLAARGWQVTLIERHAAPAREASGNPAGVFHPLISRDDNSTARITRAGFLHALARWRALERAGHDFARSRDGLLHLADSEDEARELADALRTFAFPQDYVMPVSRDEAEKRAGVTLARDGWFYPHGGSLNPAALCAALCSAAGERLDARFGVDAARLERVRDEWHVIDAQGVLIAHAPVVIFANAHDAARLAGLRHAPTRAIRGQLSLIDESPLAVLRIPVVGAGYAVPLGARTTLAGATYELDDLDAALRPAGHAENLARVATMFPALAETKTVANERGRVGFRCVTSDRLPMLGPLADEAAALADAARLRGAWPLDLPRAPGLYSAFAYGSRGLVWASLGAELIASQLEGEPWPLERELAERLDPARFLQRALRQQASV